MKWLELPDWQRSRAIDAIRRFVGMEIVSRVGPHRALMEALLAAADALDDVGVVRDAETERQRLRSELAIESADRCYQRAMSRAAQIRVNPKDERDLSLKALADMAAGDDIMRAAGIPPSGHPRHEELRRRCGGLSLGAMGPTEFSG